MTAVSVTRILPTSIRHDRTKVDALSGRRHPTKRGLPFSWKVLPGALFAALLSSVPALSPVNMITRANDRMGTKASATIFNFANLSPESGSPFWPHVDDEVPGSSGLQTRSGNPIFSGWYADPEARLFQGEYWIYPTYSAPYGQQLFMDAFSSKDLITWQKHARILDSVDVRWAIRALWAPSVVEKDGWYFLFFGANDIQNDTQQGGIGVARARQPGGPFKDYLGKPLIDKFHNDAQPIDPFVFKDSDGSHYIIYGGWKHCNIAKLNDAFNGFIPFSDGATFREITPKGYVEGSFMFVKDGKYYFMWSEGGWTGPNYAVAYAIGSSPLGPFERIGKILQQDPAVATGAGHHSVLHAPGSSKWYIVYHRRPLGESDANHRVVCIDEMHFDEDGLIRPVRITKEGVARDQLR